MSSTDNDLDWDWEEGKTQHEKISRQFGNGDFELPDEFYKGESKLTLIERIGIKIPLGIGAIMIVTMLILYAATPPGTFSILDEYRDSDNDGITDAEELKLGLNPESADSDNDGIDDGIDLCQLSISHVSGDYDEDGCYDAEDNDDDGDTVIDSEDECQFGVSNWISSVGLDNDGDGCHDSAEDDDDDNDGFNDSVDPCPISDMNYSDYDSDGCTDDMDDDDDDDGFPDIEDNCSVGILGLVLVGTLELDLDQDGCTNDADEDDDGDSILDENDNCPLGLKNWLSNSSNDHDQDGCNDIDEDFDDDGDLIDDYYDQCLLSEVGAPDYDSDGCPDSIDEDDDGDGVLDIDDNCPQGFIFITFWGFDYDGDGCEDYQEDDDDDGDGVLDENDNCSYGGSVNWNSTIETDYDLDGCRDLDEDLDDDNDGYIDEIDDFPLDESEFNDNDGDGIGDNADIDDDGDGIVESFDANDAIDVGLKLTINTFTVSDIVDASNSIGEIYFIVTLDNTTVGYFHQYSMGKGIEYNLQYSLLFDLSDATTDFEGNLELNRYHWIGIEAWDYDATDSDQLDINPSPDYRTLFFVYDALENKIVNQGDYISPVGISDGNTDTVQDDDDDGIISFSLESIDVRYITPNAWSWNFKGDNYQLNQSLSYDDYRNYRNMDHSVNESDNLSRMKFITPNSPYIQYLANELEQLAYNKSMTDIDTAGFVLEFVRSIDIMYDLETIGVGEYPKYPIEMLWEGSGDSEDSTYLYNSIMEALDYDTILIILDVKADSADGDWGGHVMSGIFLLGHSGDFVELDNHPKSGTPFYYAETASGSTEIGVFPYFDSSNIEKID
jgi:hypothetical protein